MSYRFFQNCDCEYFPCHPLGEQAREEFNCLFCFCPLYGMMDCKGNYSLLENGKKDCSLCTLPHYHYDYVIKRLME